MKLAQHILVLAYLVSLGGCLTAGSVARIHEASPLISYHDTAIAGIQDGDADSTALKGGCPVCVY